MFHSHNQLALSNLGRSDTLGPYTIQRKVGKGAYGTVYLCTLHQQQVAVKEINQQSVYHTECTILQQVQH